ncbi:hypothetical protein [Aliikangiella maris]|uniref:Uncharacterized protein n=2 Tax=Aliikangiella maris TaxID=3162458 RepID=A0ABV2C024_9GAMM
MSGFKTVYTQAELSKKLGTDQINVKGVLGVNSKGQLYVKGGGEFGGYVGYIKGAAAINVHTTVSSQYPLERAITNWFTESYKKVLESLK